MDIVDLIPINQIGRFYNLPDELIWLSVFLIFLIGYISFKHFYKSHKFIRIDGIDKIIIISLFGTILPIKFLFIFLMLAGFIGAIFQFDLISIFLAITHLILIIFLWIIGTFSDIFGIVNKEIPKKKNVGLVSFLMSIFYSFIFSLAALLTVKSGYWHYVPIYIFLIFSCMVTFNPVLSYFIRWYKYVSV